MRHQCYQILHFVSIGIHLTNNNCNNFNKKLFCPSSCEPQRSVFGSVRHYHCICQVYTKHTLCQELCNSISSAHPLRYLFFLPPSFLYNRTSTLTELFHAVSGPDNLLLLSLSELKPTFFVSCFAYVFHCGKIHPGMD